MPLAVAVPLRGTVALGVLGVRRPPRAPVLAVPGRPGPLRPRQVGAVVVVALPLALLPTPPALPLAGRLAAEALPGNLRTRPERLLARRAPPTLHGCASAPKTSAKRGKRRQPSATAPPLIGTAIERRNKVSGSALVSSPPGQWRERRGPGRGQACIDPAHRKVSEHRTGRTGVGAPAVVRSAGEVVARRSLDFCDALGRVLAVKGNA